VTPSGLEATACSHPIKDAPVGRAAKRLASRVLDRLLRAPWSQSVARARDGRRSLAAGQLGLGTVGEEAPEQTMPIGRVDLAVADAIPSHRRACDLP
jgi:hypothetical protein